MERQLGLAEPSKWPITSTARLPSSSGLWRTLSCTDCPIQLQTIALQRATEPREMLASRFIQTALRGMSGQRDDTSWQRIKKGQTPCQRRSLTLNRDGAWMGVAGIELAQGGL